MVKIGLITDRQRRPLKLKGHWNQGEAGSLSFSPLEERSSLPQLRPSPARLRSGGTTATIKMCAGDMGKPGLLPEPAADNATPTSRPCHTGHSPTSAGSQTSGSPYTQPVSTRPQQRRHNIAAHTSPGGPHETSTTDLGCTS
ncbi:Hypothetical predicted protein [Pelobates cultripes]|uniref:Uncharacterized protein n=1 Tax=Pelobates cultripes TaxID=61616 RepID=A0AAD1S537_PELCU|nr:Hypothetical predicted protein [Pelobates cultripes]